MASIHFQGGREAWLKIRDAYVGGSEVASLFHNWLTAEGAIEVFHAYQQPPGGLPMDSLSPYKTAYRLWKEKHGVIMPEDLDEVERIQAGTFLEPAIADWSKARFDWRIRKVHRYMCHETVEGWGSSLDYEIHEAGASGAPVEIKNVDFLAFRDKWEVDGDEIIAVPLHIALQVQSQIGVAGTDHGWVVACVGGNKLYRGRVARHEPTQDMIAEAVDAFWSAKGAPEWLASAEAAKEEYRVGVKDKPIDLSHDNEAPMLISRYMRWSRHAKFVEKITDGLKGRLQIKMGDATKATTAGFSMSWPAIHREARTIVQEELDYRGGFTVRATKEAKPKKGSKP